MRRRVLVVAGVLVLAAMWAHVALAPPPLPTPHPPSVAAKPAPPPLKRLSYSLRSDRVTGTIIVTNEEKQTWSNVRASVLDRDRMFTCPVPEVVASHTDVLIRVGECESAAGAAPVAWVLRITASEGGIATGIEPAVEAR
jgi:hypothetical protein